MLRHLLLDLLVSLPLLFLELLLFFCVKHAQVKHVVLCRVGIHQMVDLVGQVLASLISTVRLIGVRDHQAIPDVQFLVVLGVVGIALFVFSFSSQLLLNLVDFIVLFKGMLLQVTHVVVDIQQGHSFVDVCLHILGELLEYFHKLNQVLGRLAKLLLVLTLTSGNTHLLFDGLLMLSVLLLDVVEHVSEQTRIVHDQFVDDGSVDVLGWKLVAVALFDHFGHFCEVLGYSLSVLLDDQVVVENDVLHEAGVVGQVLEQWLELQVLPAFVFQILTCLLHENLDISV